MGEKDYSTKPLWRKLGIKEGSRVAFLGAPGNMAAVLGPLPPRVHVGTRASGSIDVIVAFETTLASLRKRFGMLSRALDPAGGLWVAYPKKASGKFTDLTFENVQRAGLDGGLVDNKSCTIDETWSAVRFVLRLKDRPRTGKR